MVEKLENPFHRFVALARFDREVQFKSRELKAAEKLLAEKRLQLEHASSRLQIMRQQVHELKKGKSAAEHELMDMSQELERKRVRLEKTSEAREYTALMNEIELLTHAYRSKESVVLTLWQQVEEAEPQLMHLEVEQKPLIDERQRQIIDEENRVALLGRELDMLKTDRPSKVNGILPDWLSLYESMRRYVEDPAALMDKNLCSGCGSVVPPANQIAVRHHQLIVCQQCRRLLYVED